MNSRDQLGWTPLHHACHTGRLDMVELLVSAGAKVDAAALHGGTPLMTAIDSRALCCVEYLINAGADVMAETKHGTTTTPTIPSAPKHTGLRTAYPICPQEPWTI